MSMWTHGHLSLRESVGRDSKCDKISRMTLSLFILVCSISSGQGSRLEQIEGEFVGLSNTGCSRTWRKPARKSASGPCEQHR